jgi:phenylacetate-coenzyme A ligase PaaK-like adenylate-forming protein
MMERSDIPALGDSIIESVIAHPPRDASRYLFRVTSGTSGSSPLVLITEYPPEAPREMFDAEEVENILSFSGSISARLANVFIASSLPEGSIARILSLEAADMTPALAGMLSDYKPHIVNGFGSFIARGLEYIADDAAAGVRRVTLFGESLTAQFDALLKEKFPHAERFEMYMALEAGGYIGSGICRSLRRGHFHPARGVTIEIFEPDEEGVGDILITKAIFGPLQLERYRIGDVGRIVPGTCPCGETVTFELLGRRGIDYIKRGGALFAREEFDRAVSAFPDLIDDYRVEVAGARPVQVRISIFGGAGRGTPGLARELADKLSRALFVTRTKTFQELVEAGVLAPLMVDFSENAFARGHKDVKLRSRV